MGSFEEYLDVNPKLVRLSRRLVAKKVLPKTKKQLYLYLAIKKVAKLLGAIESLQVRRYYQEAAYLVRSLIELQFITQYLLSDKTGKNLNEYIDYYAIYRKNLFQNIKANGAEAEVYLKIFFGEDYDEKVILRNAVMAQEKYHFAGHSWKRKSLYSMVKETSGIEFYRHFYFLYSESTHSSIGDLYNYLPGKARDNYKKYLIISNIMVSFIAAVLIIHNFCEEFNLPALKEVENLMTRAGMDIENRT